MKTEQLHWNSLKGKKTQKQFAKNIDTGIIWTSTDGWVGGFVFLFTKKKQISDWVRRILSSEEEKMISKKDQVEDFAASRWHYHLISPRPRLKWPNMFFPQETETRRSSAVSLLTTALSRSLDCHPEKRQHLAREVEKEVFAACNNLVGARYRELTRKVVFGLRKDCQAREELVAGEKTANKLVKTFIRDIS